MYVTNQSHYVPDRINSIYVSAFFISKDWKFKGWYQTGELGGAKARSKPRFMVEHDNALLQTNI